ncbi:hypothetical protein CAEBREN_31786 [Caenorhabditis brenneri]|uniref:Uncharacterized protein n=1 Tax=Caenorhabditis brenneri TaxID=135651 RepID=G0MBT2_CAEBE|nr:hypothetical protein CAEBREN_31786 [Caenorhabditis brenneri]
MNSSVLPMIDLSPGDADDADVDFRSIPCRASEDPENIPNLLFGNGNLCRSTLSINQISMAPSPFSEITVSSQKPLIVQRSGSNSSEHNALLKEVAKKKPVADIAHKSTTASSDPGSLPTQPVKIQNLPLIPSFLSSSHQDQEPFNPSATSSSAIPKSSSTGTMPRRPPLLRLAPVPEDLEEDDEVFLEDGRKAEDKQRLFKKRRFLSLLDSNDDVVGGGGGHNSIVDSDDEEQENKQLNLIPFESAHRELQFEYNHA